MKTITAVTEIKGSHHGALGPKFIIKFSDGSKTEEYWEDLHNEYNPFDLTKGKYGDYETPTTEWKVESIIGKNWSL